MESTNGQPYTWFEHEGNEDTGSAIPHHAYNGWLKITRWNRHETVMKVETVRFLGTLTGNIVYPPRPKGYPMFDDLFLQGGRKECITEAEALAWLRKHGLPLPEAQDAEATADAAGQETGAVAEEG
jgi:hypothetical protein